MTMETNIRRHGYLSRSSWVSPWGRRWPDSTLARHKPCPNSSSNAQPNHDQVALTVPETAKPGQTLKFQPCEHRQRREVAAPDKPMPNPSLTGPGSY